VTGLGGSCLSSGELRTTSFSLEPSYLVKGSSAAGAVYHPTKFCRPIADTQVLCECQLEAHAPRWTQSNREETKHGWQHLATCT